MVIEATTISLLPLVSVKSLLWSKKGRQGSSSEGTKGTKLGLLQCELVSICALAIDRRS